MFRGRDNGGLPMTGQRTAAPHISTVQLPQVSTPTLLTYVWLGASILGSMGVHHEIWMSRAEYDEHGAQLITRKGMQFTAW